MKQLEPLGFFLAGAIVGAACMHYSRNKTLIAIDREKAKAMKQIHALEEERNRYLKRLTDMLIEQANSAGYVDGYHAGQREMEAGQGIGIVNGVFAQSLRDGKKVTWTVLDR